MTIEEKKVDKEAESVWAKFAYTASDGKTYQVDYYNLDVIISVGYRVKSVQGTKFRIWATSVLRQYLLQGYSVNHHLIALQENMDKRMTPPMPPPNQQAIANYSKLYPGGPIPHNHGVDL